MPLLAQFHRVLAPGGVLLLQIPVLDATTTTLDAAATAAPGTARWAFGMDVLDRITGGRLRAGAPGDR